jgi:eukaryotic-like serine/threonine-protein kinase
MSAVASGVAGADGVASKAVFRTSRVSALVLGAVTTVGAIVCLAISQESSAARESGAALLFFIAFVLFAVPACRLLWILVRPGRWVEVSGDGITLGKGDRRHKLAWSQVARVRVVEDKRRPWLVVWPRDQQAAQIELGGAYSELHGGFRVFPVGHERRRTARAREVRELRAALGWYGRATYDPSP